MPINKLFIEEALNHITDITNKKCTINDEQIIHIYNQDPVKAEFLSGLLFLHETLEFQREEYINANKELEKKNIALQEFAYISSHDLKSPLRSINSLANFIEEDLKDNNQDEIQNSINLIKEKIEKMENLIDGLLEYSTIINSELIFNKIDLNETIKNVESLLHSSSDFKITVPSPLPTISGVKIKIFQLFYNLIENSLKYSDKQHCNIEISYTESTEHYTFYIKDNGPGIDKKFHKKIFEIFQTIENKNTKTGTGIGLFLVKKIVSIHNGTIEIESNPDKKNGCTFIIKLPKKIN